MSSPLVPSTGAAVFVPPVPVPPVPAPVPVPPVPVPPVPVPVPPVPVPPVPVPPVPVPPVPVPPVPVPPVPVPPVPVPPVPVPPVPVPPVPVPPVPVPPVPVPPVPVPPVPVPPVPVPPVPVPPVPVPPVPVPPVPVPPVPVPPVPVPPVPVPPVPVPPVPVPPVPVPPVPVPPVPVPPVPVPPVPAAEYAVSSLVAPVTSLITNSTHHAGSTGSNPAKTETKLFAAAIPNRWTLKVTQILIRSYTALGSKFKENRPILPNFEQILPYFDIFCLFWRHWTGRRFFVPKSCTIMRKAKGIRVLQNVKAWCDSPFPTRFASNYGGICHNFDLNHAHIARDKLIRQSHHGRANLERGRHCAAGGTPV